MQQPIYSVASRKILEIQVLRAFFRAFLSRIQVFHYFSSIFLFFTKGCGKCRCSIMGLLYLVVRKWMMEMVFLLTTTLLFQYFSIITHPALRAPLLLEGNVCDAPKSQGISESRGPLLLEMKNRLRNEDLIFQYYYTPRPMGTPLVRGEWFVMLQKVREFRRVGFTT